MKSDCPSYPEPRKAQGVASAHYGTLNVCGVSVAEEPATIKSFLDVFSLAAGLGKHPSAKCGRLKNVENIYTLSN